MRRAHLPIDRLAYVLALLAGVLPLWVTGHLPFVDQPQHLHLISVLQRLTDPTTLYPTLFEMRAALTTYLGYYYIVGALAGLMPLDVANKMFLTAYVVAMPLSMAFLLRSLGRPAWPSLLAVPFAYGDSLAWGFVNYCAAIPLTFVSSGLVVRAIADVRRRRLWAALLAVSFLAVALFHVQALVFAAVALPVLLLTTRAPGQNWLRARGWALAAVAPAGLLFAGWLGPLFGRETDIVYGAPWKAWGPMFSSQNLAYKPFAQNVAELPRVLANMLRDSSDRYGFYAACLCAVAGLVAGLLPRWRDEAPGESGLERCRLAVLATVALGLFFIAPFDIRGHAYYVNTRYAHLAAPLVLAAVPVVRPSAARALTLAAAVAVTLTGLSLARGFAAFDGESRALDAMVEVTAPRPMVAGLVFDPGSGVVNHPVYLHAGAVLARARGGATNFSFALTPYVPIRYKTTPPPTFPSEWRPDQFDYRAHGPAYDHFVVRGVAPQRLFGPRLERELYVAGQAGGFSLVRRRAQQGWPP